MNVHNIMEEQVMDRVTRLYDQVLQTNASWLTCSCEHCQLDTLSYVLNRVPPKYVVSGRGLTHSVAAEDKQLVADIDKLILEGMHAVSSVRRPYHGQKGLTQNTESPVFNFPTVIGNVFDGLSFEPVSNACVTLLCDGLPVDMVDYTWSNPCSTTALTNGAFTFWAKPQPSEKEGESKVFKFTLVVTAPGREKLVYLFDVPVVSEKSVRELNSNFSVKIPDLVMFAPGEE